MNNSENKASLDEQKERKTENGEFIWVLLFLMLAFGGWGNCENPRMAELEKKVAMLEGQMSMIGGKLCE